MRNAALLLLASMLFCIPLFAKADTWVPYTDGRAGGCMLNSANVLYGCTPQPAQQSGNRNSAGYQLQSREDYCWQQRQKLKNANSDFHRTVTSMRAAEERFARSGCE